MTTHCLIRIADNGVCLVNIYQQYDGYPRGVGRVLANYLSKVEFADDLSYFAPAFIQHIKEGPGYVCLYPPSHEDEEFIYEVSGGWDRPVTVACMKNGKTIFRPGSAAEFLAFCEAAT